MSRYRLYPTAAQEKALLEHCAHARYVWNLAVEQREWWQPGRPVPGYSEQCRQLSEARAASPWLATGSVIVQQQALRDFTPPTPPGSLRSSSGACATPSRRRSSGQPHRPRRRGANADAAKASGSSPSTPRTCGA
ncbi:MAG: helix-turn-helix domain-containing protein [Actinomycetes bacterium]